jgi:hypothetical protein
VNTTDTLEVMMMPGREIRPSPENDRLYRPIDRDSPDFVALVKSIRERGILEPIVATLDGYIVSGHRRYAAGAAAGLTDIPVRVLEVRREGNIDEFIRLLAEYNRQRIKSFDEQVNEAIVNVDPKDAYRHLLRHRKAKLVHGQVSGSMVVAGKRRARCGLSSAKRPLLDAVKKIINDNEHYWPLSDRQIHYRLLNDPPLIHASKPDSIYANDKRSYRAVTDLLTRGRLAGEIPWRAIGDSTRPFTVCSTWPNAGAFVAEEVGDFLIGYWRDLVQSQASHIEIFAEKLTVAGIIKPVAMAFCLPLTVGRGFCSIQPRHDLAERFKASGRDRLTVLLLSDHDPDGVSICESFARSMLDDFGIGESALHAVKVALNAEQIERLGLPPGAQAKKTSPRYAEFKRRYGDKSWELEAIPPDILADELHEAIESVIDWRAYTHEQQQEAQDARELEARRKVLLSAMGGAR